MAAANNTITVSGLTLDKGHLEDLTKLRPPFEETPDLQGAFRSQLAHDWQLDMVSKPGRTGYDGALFSTEIDGKPHYFVYHQGTNDIKDLPSISRLGNGKIPQQMIEADAFNEQVKDFVAKAHPDQEASITQVGYSLGSALAILAADGEQAVIAFEGTGSKKLLEACGRDPKEEGTRVLEVLSPHPNLVNSHEEHIGDVLIAGEKYWQADHASLVNYVNMAAHSHFIKNVGTGIASLDTLETTPADKFEWPNEVWDSLLEYIDDYKSETPSVSERALIRAAHAIDKSGLDKTITRLIASGADAIASCITRTRGDSLISERPQTHPAVMKRITEPDAPVLQQSEAQDKAAQVETPAIQQPDEQDKAAKPAALESPQAIAENPSDSFAKRIAAQRAQSNSQGARLG